MIEPAPRRNIGETDLNIDIEFIKIEAIIITYASSMEIAILRPGELSMTLFSSSSKWSENKPP